MWGGARGHDPLPRLYVKLCKRAVLPCLPCAPPPSSSKPDFYIFKGGFLECSRAGKLGVWL